MSSKKRGESAQKYHFEKGSEAVSGLGIAIWFMNDSTYNKC